MIEFMVKQQQEISAVGFYSHDGSALFLYNSYEDRFDNWKTLDLSEVGFKYHKASMKEAKVCMKMEGNVGELKEISLFI
jgi:hypothetical protein